MTFNAHPGHWQPYLESKCFVIFMISSNSLMHNKA